MANVVALTALNINYLNFKNVYDYVTARYFYDNDPYSYGLPVEFQDAIELHYGDNGILAFAGTGFSATGYKVTGGTVEGIIDVGEWKVYGLKLKATDVYNAYLTEKKYG